MTDITKFKGYTRNESDSDYFSVHEFTDWHRPEGAHYVAAVETQYDRDGNLNRAYLRVRPDGYWSEVVTATVESRYGSKLHVDISSSSGGWTSEDDPENGVVGVADPVERMDYFMEAIRAAQEFARFYRSV